MGLAVCLIIIIATIIGYFKWKQSYWRRRGVDGPKGLPFIGNFYELADPEKPRGFILSEWGKKFGKVFGYYEGVIPVLVVSDLDMLQELFVKKFDCFYARKSTNVIHGDLENPKEEPRVHLFVARGSRWKRLRSLASPAFSVKALKQVHGVVEDSVNIMVELMSKHADDGSFNIHEYFQELTFDVISRLAMGQPRSEQFNNPSVQTTQKIFLKTHRVIPWYLSVMFPQLEFQIKQLFFNHVNIRGGDAGKIHQLVEKAVMNKIAERENMISLGIENPEKDFIDMFLDYCSETVEDSQFGQVHEKRTTTEEVIGSCYLFLLAGFDTTANSLGYAAYLLAKNPETLRKAQQEIDEVCTTPDISYDQCTKLNYLEAVVKEALRMYPVASFACSRECVTPTTLGSYKIDPGTKIEADVLTLHKSKEIWGDNAEEYVPERWIDSAPRHNMSWIPFGAGPRQCIGMRLGILEAKLALAAILKKFDITSGPDTEKELSFLGCTTTSPVKVTVYLKTRNF